MRRFSKPKRILSRKELARRKADAEAATKENARFYGDDHEPEHIPPVIPDPETYWEKVDRAVEEMKEEEIRNHLERAHEVKWLEP